ncbi:MAG: SGNH/GDSL hydrolase family protein [Flavobacteriaceae bacterium]|jgi:lysophospholipase L1-like esterase|nr:SGNH/GDSL hydrolase family protein [Flavobacteriaceae bacterium]
MKSTNCLFFGDSITFGEYDGVHGGWVDALKRYSYDKFYNEGKNEVNVYNLGIGGESTEGLLKRLKIEIEARTTIGTNLVFFFYGANDLVVRNGLNTMEVEQFATNLKEAIAIAHGIGAEVCLISVLPIADAVEGIASSTGKVRTTDRILLFNEKGKAIAKECKVDYVDLYNDFWKCKEEWLSRDGVHPNEKGYAWISEKMKVYIDRHL